MTTGGDERPPQHVWVASELYWPEETSTGYFLTEIAESLAADWPVSVLCGQPKYDRKGFRAPPRERRNGVEIFRSSGTTLNKNVLPFRLINMFSIALRLFGAALRHFRRGDIVIVTTNPPALPFVIAAAARMRGARTVLILHDVYPDVLVAAGLAKPGSVLVKLLAAWNRWLYESTDRICVIGRDMAALIRERVDRITHPDRVVVIPNWGDVEAVVPSDQRSNALLRELGLSSRFVVQYAGNAGPVHGIETIVDAARLLAESDPDVHFLFLGGGRKWRWLENAVKRYGLSNVTTLAPRRREEQATFLAACDVAVSAFVPGMSGIGVPSRMYNIMAAGRAQIAAVDDGSEQALVIREEGVGWVTPPGSPEGLVAAIQAARNNPDELVTMGRRARVAALTKYDRRVILEQYRMLVRQLTLQPPG